jgi:phosphoglycolate phosphatase
MPSDSLAHIRFLLWDWNGTLLDDVDLCVAVLAEMIEARALPAVSPEIYRAGFGFPVIGFYRQLGFDTSPEAFGQISEIFIRRYYECFRETSRTHAESVAFARAWRVGGGLQAVLSASRQDHLEAAVRHHGLETLFARLGGIGDIFAGGKLERGRELLGSLGWDPGETLLIGDTDHDAEVAAALGTECLLVARGHQTPERLRATGQRVVESLDEARVRHGLRARPGARALSARPGA